MAEKEDKVEVLTWRRETVGAVMSIVGTRLPQRDLVSLLLVSSWLHRTLVSYPSLWQVLDFHEMTNAGNRLLTALSQPRYKHVRQINLEFGQDIEDKHFEILKNEFSSSLQHLEMLNLNGCQKIFDKGLEAITYISPSLKVFSIYWNVRITDIGIQHLVKNCKHVVDLNLSGCKNITDHSMQLIADCYQDLESLNITRCIRLSDSGLDHVLTSCSSLQNLNLYALSRFTDRVYTKISLLPHLRVLDLCGAQNLSDEGLACIAKCKKLVSLNLTWCVRITDVGVLAVARNCTSLELVRRLSEGRFSVFQSFCSAHIVSLNFLMESPFCVATREHSLFGIVGVTDKSLEALSRSCAGTLETLDINGCVNIKRRSHEELLQLFPQVKCFKVHS